MSGKNKQPTIYPSTQSKNLKQHSL